MHIAYNAWFWDQPYTGSGQYLRQLVKALRQLEPGLKISLVMPHWITSPDEVPPGVDVIPVKVTPGGQMGKVWFEQRLYPAAAGKLGADIAHVPYWGAPLTSPVRLVVTVHDVIPLSMPVYQGGIGARLYFSLVRATARGAGEVITDSEFSRQEIIKQIGCPAAQVTSILLAAGPEFHPRLGAERDSEIRQKYALPEHYALYLGGFDVRKNVRALLAAYTYVGSAVGEDYPLVLAGKTPEDWGSPRFPDLRAEIAEKPGLAQYIRWIGPVDEADKPGIYRMARVFAFPSRYEGFGLGPLEAMACGTPVVAADASSVPEVVGESAYLVDPDDSRAMGAALISVLIQDDLHDSLRNAGLARASNFSWERTARETLQVYQRVMADRNKS
jgi:glycosyltransferase involved in cell wall biosynthesis